MPQGFGIYHNALPTADEEKVLAGLSVPAGDPDALTNAATAAVDALRQSGAGQTGGDHSAPAVRALPGSAKVGGSALLRWTVSDDSGKAKETVRVYGAGFALYATIAKPLGPAKAGVVQTVTWRVPKALKPGAIQFCVLAQDAAGNQSKPACAPLKIS